MNRKIFIAVLIAAALMIFTAPGYATGWGHHDAVGAVYTMTNDATDNEVVIFSRNEDGILTKTEIVRFVITTQSEGYIMLIILIS